ncbi:MAG TPA: LiaF domain-containing protein [Flavitalea sp.]|nr:LiaF domain-containing protein [Flavitalea sp.]
MRTTEQRFRKRLSKRRENFIGGIILLVIGSILLARQVGVELPPWLFTWPMILIIVGIFVGIKTKFRDLGWVFLVGGGVFFLLDKIQHMAWRQYTLPIIVLGAGLLVLFGAFFTRSKVGQDGSALTTSGDTPVENIPHGTTEEVMEVVSIFGSTKRVVLSKAFKGGEIISVFGSSEINLTNADFSGKLVLEIVQIFGGTKLIIPPHWEVHSKTATVFGGIEDKRSIPVSTNSEKILVLEGTTFFGGVTIASY